MAHLKPVGFWGPQDEGGGIAARVDADWAASPAAATLLAYLRGGLLESHELAYSYCRFKGCTAPPKELGLATLTDGVWVWPEGLAHYVETHGVKPESDFLAHVAAVVASKGGVPAPGNHLLYTPLHETASRDGEDEASPLSPSAAVAAARGAATPVPRGTAAYLATASTLRMEG